MSCTRCLKNYGLFNKEVGCPGCGYSFCSKCLQKTIEVLKHGSAKKKVCLSCFDKLSNSPKPEDPKLPYSTTIMDSEERLPPALDLDKFIADKLNDLKKSKNQTDELQPMTDEEIAARLANLRGVNPKDYTKSTINMIHTVDRRTDQEKINDLLKQFEEESNLNVNYEAYPIDPTREIEEKLAKLRGEPFYGSTKNKTEFDFEEVDEATTLKNIVSKAFDEAKWDEGLTPEEKEFISTIPKASDDPEELPWCTICNEDAIIRCLSCDGDLFCRACFKEIHDDEEYQQHRTEKYQKPKNSDL